MSSSLLADAQKWATQHLASRAPARGQRQELYAPYYEIARQLLAAKPRVWTRRAIVQFLFSHPTEGPKLRAAGITQPALNTALSRHFSPPAKRQQQRMAAPRALAPIPPASPATDPTTLSPVCAQPLPAPLRKRPKGY